MLDKKPYLVYRGEYLGGEYLIRNLEIENLETFQCSIVYLDLIEAKKFSDFLSRKRKGLSISRIESHRKKDVSEIIEYVLKKTQEQERKKLAKAKTKKDPEKEKERKEKLARKRQAEKDKKILEDLKKRGLVKIEEQNEQV